MASKIITHSMKEVFARVFCILFFVQIKQDDFSAAIEKLILTYKSKIVINRWNVNEIEILKY